MSDEQSRRLIAHCRLVAVIERLKRARDKQQERGALLELWATRLAAVEVPVA